MTVLAQLTFAQELLKESVGALSTALFVGIAAALVVARHNRRREQLREEAAARRSLLERTSDVGSSFWIVCQHSSRALPAATDDTRRTRLLDELDDAYHEFIVQAVRLENELWAWFGRNTPLGRHHADQAQHPPADDVRLDPAVVEDTLPEQAWERWHQIRDLLTLYYFNLKATHTGDRVFFDIVGKNSIGHDGEFHSGLRFTVSGPDSSNLDTELEAIREVLRRGYESALGYLVRAILEGRMTSAHGGSPTRSESVGV